MTVIIDYGMGNLGSIKNMLKKLGFDSTISSSREEISEASRLFLPGVGNFKRAMDNLHDKDLVKPIQDAVGNEVPFLGICLGMQLLADFSEEGDATGLGLIPGRVEKFQLEKPLKVPHMGWNYVSFKDSPLFDGFQEFEETRFYFVHSYHYKCSNEEHSIGTTEYGHQFTSVVNSGKVFGAQFHPEKSHKYGMKLFENFMRIS